MISLNYGIKCASLSELLQDSQYKTEMKWISNHWGVHFHTFKLQAKSNE